MRRLVVIITFGLIALATTRVEAHGMRTAYVEVNELSPGHALVHLRITAFDPTLAVTSRDCALAPDGDGSIYDRRWLLDCGAGLEGHTLALTGLGPIVSEAVVSITFADRTNATHLVRQADATIALRPRSPSQGGVARKFVALGLGHIVTGYDHLLFLLLLVLLLRELRSVLLAETAFTLSHSLSFSATAFGWIHVSSDAAETCIALSLVLLAADVRLQGPPPPRWRGAGAAFVFGLVHGLGFAGGLREIGLPQHAIASALLGFGAGVELGQVAFLAIVLVILNAARKLTVLAPIQRATIYAIGGLSAYWFLARAITCLWWA